MLLYAKATAGVHRESLFAINQVSPLKRRNGEIKSIRELQSGDQKAVSLIVARD